MQTNLEKNSKKKVGLLTFHFVHNAGAMLQCYASQKTLSSLGLDCEVIDYQPFPLANFYSLHTLCSYSLKRYWKTTKLKGLKKFLVGVKDYGFLIFKNNRAFKKRFKYYREFLDKFNKSPICYNQEDLEKLKYDGIVVGSDQVWNDSLNYYDKNYFLDYDCKNAKKFTFAVSCGGAMPQEKFDKHSAAIKDFDYLSVREDELSNQLLNEGIENRIDLDPVFLLSKEEWQSQSKPMKIDGKFIFVYTFAFNEKLKQAIKDAQKRFNCQVIVLMPFTGEKVEKIENCKVIHNYGPREFLYCIDKAEHVITHSFHATAFSIIFNKKFTFVSSALPGRIESLFRKLEITDTENITQKSYQLLEAERQRTKEYLEKIAKEL